MKLRGVLFGKPSVYWNEKKIVFPFAKMEALLYYLLVCGEATREKLAALLWGDMEDHAAKRNLRNTLYLLKKMFSADLLETPSRTLIVLNRREIAAVDLALISPEGIGTFLDQNPGEFLEGFCCKDAPAFDSWVTERREQYRKDCVHYLTKWIIQLMNQRQDYAAAKRYLKRLIALDAYNEGAYRVLMKMYAREDAHKAIGVYRELERKMARDLGLKPSLKTQEMLRRLQDKKGRVAAAKNPPAEAAFYGREAELAQMKQWLDAFHHPDAAARRKPLLLLQGAQGVGKSAVVERLFALVPTKAAQLLRGQCYQAEFEYPYKAWSPIFVQAMQMLRAAGEALPPLWLRVIAYIFPNAAACPPGLERDETADPVKFGATMVEEILAEILAKAARRRKLALWLEDVHWLDQQSWRLLWHVLRVQGDRIACIATCHQEYSRQTEKMVELFERGNMVQHVPVGRFSAADVAQLAAMRLPGVSRELQTRLYMYTGGNALFLTECLNLIAAGKDIQHGSIRLNHVLKERVGNASDSGRKVLETASVFFNRVRYEALQAVTAMDEFELVEVLEELQRKQLLMEVNDGDRGETAYQICNLQIRNYVYDQMSALRQRMLNKRAAFYWERELEQGRRSRDLYENILYYYGRADEKMKTLEYTIRLTEKYYCPQYEMFPELDPYYPVGDSNFRESRGRITAHLEKIKELLQALQRNAPADARLTAYQIAFGEIAGRYHIWQGDHRRGLRLIHRMLYLAARQNMTEYRIKGYQQIIYLGIQTRRPRLIREFALKLQRLNEHDAHPEKKATALRFLGLASAMEKRYAEAEAFYQDSLALFKKLAVRNHYYVFTIAAANNYIGDLRRESFDYEAALRSYAAAVRIAGRKNISEGVTLFYINAGCAAFELGDYEQAGAYLNEALALAEGVGDPKGYWCLRGYCTLHCALALIAARRGRPADARRHLEQADRFLRRYNDPYQSGRVFCAKAEIRWQMERDAAAASVFADYLLLPPLDYCEQARKIFIRLDRPVELAALDEMAKRRGRPARE